MCSASKLEACALKREGPTRATKTPDVGRVGRVALAVGELSSDFAVYIGLILYVTFIYVQIIIAIPLFLQAPFVLAVCLSSWDVAVCFLRKTKTMSLAL